ncbi:3'(2'),5'-bisphosphate nucleotidase CysQ [Rossellomorea vietnamensis]|uniref:3'(2'),5'-bisphosphate nucleotidase CysQ n=1 Tax=Rossellomorea vietnamensis TaxID=218284 RepID=A0ACD4CA04_9BACI|nr:3'(2'),5'-bisphosphate nucleotidase CysQ [Rossellomorea vietnamensis]UXH45322.1 3'(2'),5'-bisphosphate nucleotidase CysQ [Rossellomorea vietnamensis]
MLNEIIEIAIGAGKKILEVYEDAYTIHEKEDRSPLTVADQLSHSHIQTELSNLFPTIPILSEEGASTPFNERKNWSSFWLVDPLDGTKEFIKKNGEFTVNIALIQENRPILGIVYAPVTDTLYYAEENQGAYKLISVSSSENRKQVKITTVSSGVKKVVISRSHLSEDTREYIDDLQRQEGKLEFTSIGSSLKFCLIAEGSAHYYPRLAPTMEWDTAAGQMIVEEAYGQVIEYETGTPLVYNKKVLTNPSFICSLKR